MSMTKQTVSAVIAAVLMSVTAGAASHIKPDKYLADTRGDRKLASMIPSKFGIWEEMAVNTGIVNPQQRALLETIYSEQVTRTYRSPEGYRIMLSIAYGRNQNDGFQVHWPEICYPAQGFQVESVQKTHLQTPYGAIPVKHLLTTYQSQRIEPVTYWSTIGDHSVESGVDKKLKEMRYAMGGHIADGLLFRISSVDPNPEHAQAMQDKFILDLLAQIPAADRLRLAGLPL